VLANGLLLVRGATRLSAELAREQASARTADLLRIAWTYGMLGNLCLGSLLAWTAYSATPHDALASRVAAITGVYYVAVGITTWATAGRRHTGLLVFSVLGFVLLAVTLAG
jgi:hypothetical protein